MNGTHLVIRREISIPGAILSTPTFADVHRGAIVQPHASRNLSLVPELHLLVNSIRSISILAGDVLRKGTKAYLTVSG